MASTHTQRGRRASTVPEGHLQNCGWYKNSATNESNRARHAVSTLTKLAFEDSTNGRPPFGDSNRLKRSLQYVAEGFEIKTPDHILVPPVT